MFEENNPISEKTPKPDNKSWEREMIEKLAFSALVEQRRTRRWGIFFKCLLFLYMFIVGLAAFWPLSEKTLSAGGKHTAVIEINGIIADGGETDAQTVIDGLKEAIEDKRTRGVILKINSPGGSPVQADYIHKEILRLRHKHPKVPIHAVVTDLCASGGYYIASAADKIFVNPSSLIGSIGVIMDGFGFVSTMEKLGIERRVLIAGEHKALLDPFSPIDESERGHIQVLLNKVHSQFIHAVKQGRGDRLKNEPNLFTGLIWTGEQSIQLGLADSEGDVHSVARNEIGAEEVVDFTPEKRLLDRIAHRFGSMMGQTIREFAEPKLRF